MSIETEKDRLRSTVKALDYKCSQLARKMALDVGIRGDFFADELPFQDKRIYPNDRSKYFHLKEKLSKATFELEKLEYGEDMAVARDKTFKFINDCTLKEVLTILDKLGCNDCLELCQRVLQEPNLLEEVIV